MQQYYTLRTISDFAIHIIIFTDISTTIQSKPGHSSTIGQRNPGHSSTTGQRNPGHSTTTGQRNPGHSTTTGQRNPGHSSTTGQSNTERYISNSAVRTLADVAFVLKPSQVTFGTRRKVCTGSTVR